MSLGGYAIARARCPLRRGGGVFFARRFSARSTISRTLTPRAPANSARASMVMRRSALSSLQVVALERLTRSTRSSKATSWATRSARSSAATAAFSPLVGSLSMLAMGSLFHMEHKVAFR
nr:MAG TPA: hypothetical protein [Caudoviricetes sp.]DAR93629.1 MAG TPA: hypothetical protein [Caudoviricetes sp.]DAY26477.1 MAG TPA: hypothetical protein [Caudoviricetes sp.]